MVASSKEDIAVPSFHEPIMKEAIDSISCKNKFRILSVLKNSTMIDLMCLCASPTKKDIDDFPTISEKDLGQPGSNIFVSFLNRNRFNSGSPDTTIGFPKRLDTKIFPNLQPNSL